MPMPSKAQLKINSLTRLLKEHEEYQIEEKELDARLKTLQSESTPDEYEIRSAKRVLEETEKVLGRVAQAIREHATEVSKLGSLKPEEDAQAKKALAAAAKI